MFAQPSRTLVELPRVLEESAVAPRRSIVTEPGLAAAHDPAVLAAAADVLRASLAPEFLDPFAPVAARDAAIAAVLRPAIAQARQSGGILARLATDMPVLKQVFATTIGWGPAQRYLDDPRITEIKIVGARILVQEIGQPFVAVAEQFPSADLVTSRAKLLADLLGVPLDANHPQQTLPLAHGTRVHVTIAPAATNGSTVCIRRGRSHPWDLADLEARGAMDAPTAELLRLLCRVKASVLIVGSTGSGKTTLLECLANSWEGQPHVVTIEDGTQEIMVKPGNPWTREQVDTARDPHDFSTKAREALRQTPGLLLAGETRSYEAGAILSLLTSDHPTMTTIHALSAADGLERFASCAALPQAYMYAGRRNDALRDATKTFDAAIYVENLADSGRRVVSEIVLARGVVAATGGIAADTVTLVHHELDEAGSSRWVMPVRLEDDLLRWADAGPTEPAPPQLRLKLRRARAARLARGTTPTLDGAASAIERAESLLQAGNGHRALEALRTAWAERRDPQLLQVAHRAIALIGGAVALECLGTNQALHAELTASIAARRWSAAAATFDTIMARLDVAAALIPPAGWESYGRLLGTAQAATKRATERLDEARALIAAGDWRAALSRLEITAEERSQLEIGLETAILEARVIALAALERRGDASQDALEAAAMRLNSLQLLATELEGAA